MTPRVTVSLITYNHARFIEQAIESVLAQQTDFPFELVIGEDESSDGTREIVQRYEARFPEIIRAHYHSRATNVGYGGKPTGRVNFVHNLRSARGKYVALLDGDDYFIDSEKLQRQVDFLEAHPACSTCFHRVITVDEVGATLPVPAEPLTREFYRVEDLLRHRFTAPTASVMFRRGFSSDFPEWYWRCPAGDFPLHVLHGQSGGFGFLDRVMSAYRIHAGGRWSAIADYAATGEERQRAAEGKLRQLKAVLHLYEILGEIGLPPRQRRALRAGRALFHLQSARAQLQLGDHAALRAHLGAALCDSPGAWWPAARLLLSSALRPFSALL